MERFGITPYTRVFQGFSVRTIFMFVIAALSAGLLWATFVSQPVNAAEDQATWDGAALSYDGHQFIDNGKAKRNQFPGISEGVHYFTASDNQKGSATTPHDVFVLYFSPGVDPPSAKTARVVTFTYDPTTKTYSKPTDQKSVAITGTQGENATSCAVEGVGWIVCQVSNFLATGMDYFFDIVSGFMDVQPISTQNDSGLYVAWNIMRNIANIAFIIAFIIIVYSQMTNIAIANYGIKKLLPRLIIAAILVNLSYLISAIAVDLSNILGHSFEDIFINLRNQIFHVTNETWNEKYMTSWESVTGFVLSGGTAALAGGIGVLTTVAATGGTILSAVYLILPALVGLLVTILVVLLILAARQAIITILIVISPLAFVAYLLPSTEKWFTKWRELFMTMLIFFPAFSVVFGGAQLAGALIIQNASSINIVILGMIVQVAPLAIAPLLLKFSGGLLGRIAGIVNNPNKGLIDRTRKFANDRAGYHRDRGISGMKRNGQPGELKKHNIARRASRWANSLSSNFEHRAHNAKTAADTSYRSSKSYSKIHDNAALHNADKEILDAGLARHEEHNKTQLSGSQLYAKTVTLATEKQGLEADKAKATLDVERVRLDRTSDLHVNTLRAKTAEEVLSVSTKSNAASMEEYKSGLVAPTGELSNLVTSYNQAAIDADVQDRRAASAQHKIKESIATAISAKSVAGDALRKVAGGVAGSGGAFRAAASAKAVVQGLEAEAIKNIQATVDVKPGELPAISEKMVDAIRRGDDIQARAYQGSLLGAGGAGIDVFRKAITELGADIPVDIQQRLRDHIIAHHGDVKPKGNDIMEWAVKGDLMATHSGNATMWAGLSDKDFIGHHPKAQILAINSGAYDADRIKGILTADAISGNTLTDDIKKMLFKKAGLPEDWKP